MKALVKIFNFFVFAACPNKKCKRSFWVCESVSFRYHHKERSLHLFVSSSQLVHLSIDDMRMAGQILAGHLADKTASQIALELCSPLSIGWPLYKVRPWPEGHP